MNIVCEKANEKKNIYYTVFGVLNKVLGVH